MTIQEMVKKQKEYNEIHNEGGEGYNPYDAIISAELDRQAKTPIWTREETQSKREAWNNDVRALNHTATIADREALERKHGFTFISLCCEIKKHNL